MAGRDLKGLFRASEDTAELAFRWTANTIIDDDEIPLRCFGSRRPMRPRWLRRMLLQVRYSLSSQCD